METRETSKRDASGSHSTRGLVQGQHPGRMLRTAMGVFLFFGAGMACFAGTTLVWRGTALDRAWELNPVGYRELTRFGTWIGLPFFMLSAAMLVAGIGWFRRRLWAWRLTVGMMAAHLVGDLVNVIRGAVLEGAIGLFAVGVVLAWMLRNSVKKEFDAREHG